MKIFYLSLLFLLFFSCTNDSIVNNCFQNFTFSDVIDLDNAEFVDLQVPGTNVIFSRTGRNILIIRRTTTSFKAFDLECPERSCTTSMTFDGLKLKCSCHNKEYSTLSGGCSVNSNGECLNDNSCNAMEYVITSIGNNALQITR